MVMKPLERLAAHEEPAPRWKRYGCPAVPTAAVAQAAAMQGTEVAVPLLEPPVVTPEPHAASASTSTSKSVPGM